MNFQCLLENSDFDENKIKLLDALVETFYKTNNNNERALANQILNEFKLKENSWQHCDKILNVSSNIYTKIYAISILEDLVNTKFNLLANDQKELIRNFVIDILLKTINSGVINDQINSLINKLNIVVVAIAKIEWSGTWSSFMTEICSSGKSSQEICENNFKILIMLNEEINEFWKNTLTQNKAKQLQDLMLKESHQVYDLCMFIFDNSLKVKKSLIKLAFRLYAASVKYFNLDKVFDENLIKRFFEDLNKISSSRLDIMKCLSEIFAIPLSIEINGEDVYYNYKNNIVKLFNNYIKEMQILTNNVNISQEYQKIREDQKFNYEDFILQFSLSIINFFKNNFAFIQEFDTIAGSFTQESEFTQAYMKEICIGLNYLTQAQQITSNEEIFKSTCEFFEWFAFKICYLPDRMADFEKDIPLTPLSESINLTRQSNYYNNYYSHILNTIRTTVIQKMIRPSEVKIDVDECGELIIDELTGTIYVSLHNTMRNCLIYLTHLDAEKTEDIMIKTLETQMVDNMWNVNLLNSTSWAIGCISGALSEEDEKKFVVTVIKYLLTLCENKKGKVNKAAVASNIMYVVGQYFRFLNKYWQFLKTVVKKLFEFMHEHHPGVQDFACETFLRISLKCGNQFVIVNQKESEPYINNLVREMVTNTQDLKPHQKLMFYEAIGNMIFFETDGNKQGHLVSQMMQSLYENWIEIYKNAATNTNVFLDNQVIKFLDFFLKINEKVASAVKTYYYFFAKEILKNIIDTYNFFSNNINQIYQMSQENNNQGNVRSMKTIKKSTLKYLNVLINSINNNNVLLNDLLPQLSTLIEIYKTSHQDNRDHEVLTIFTSCLDQLKNLPTEIVESIWNHLCIHTLSMIQQDYSSFPEHRLNFFEIIKSLITNDFQAIFKIPDQNFNKNVINAIIWAFRHTQHNLAEVGLETLIRLLNEVNRSKVIDGINIADPFYKQYYFEIMNEIFAVLTDSFHKSNFHSHAEVLNILISVVSFEPSIISENLFNSEDTNKNAVFKYIVQINSLAFTHINKLQIESFSLTLFNNYYNLEQFKAAIRDFLVNLKSFSGNNEELFEAEKRQQIEQARLLEEKKKQNIPGLMPVYQDQSQFDVQKYQMDN